MLRVLPFLDDTLSWWLIHSSFAPVRILTWLFARLLVLVVVACSAIIWSHQIPFLFSAIPYQLIDDEVFGVLLVTTIGTGKLKTISDIRVLGYSPSGDYIGMPALSQFTSTDTYYSTLFHEPTHWTGTHNRCNREMGKRFGDKQYAIEELVAELGAIFHCPI